MQNINDVNYIYYLPKLYGLWGYMGLPMSNKKQYDLKKKKKKQNTN